jgi:hypothetical protein
LVGRHIADVVDQDVDATELIVHFPGQPFDVIPSADIGLYRHRLTPVRPHCTRNLFRSRRGAVKVNGDVRAFLRQRNRYRGPETASCSCYDSELPVQSAAHSAAFHFCYLFAGRASQKNNFSASRIRLGSAFPMLLVLET